MQLIITNIKKMRTNNNNSNRINSKKNKTLLPLLVKILVTQTKNINIYILKEN